MAKAKELPPQVGGDLPPTPPDSDDASSSSSSSASHNGELLEVSFPLPPKAEHPTSVLEQDQSTPDKHVPRDPRLIRLTGVHPFNVEAPLSALFNKGFLTPPELFYVRNHGPVPEVADDTIPDWELSIEGEVDNPYTISLKDILEEFEVITCPITLVCAGNRRKEQNMVRKTKGFSWGPAGLSTALFTGVTMWDVIKKAKPRRKGKYVCMEGADELPNGYYGTSVKMSWVRDPNKGFMISHMMNGEMLTPDHGKPLRAVIPGQIGGRSVKWLTKLIVSEAPSANWYHLMDNRVLPTQVSPEEAANNLEWWKDERYAIFDLNANSAIAYPAHDEQLTISDAPEHYRMKGYAYAGGGRRITRVEISMNRGKTWLLADIEYPEDLYREAPDDTHLFGGRLDMTWRDSCFCWCFWHFDVPVSKLSESKDVLVRCMDDGLMVQPRDIYWSSLGMMNNPWFRVCIHKDGDSLKFEHPTQPALIPGGWMDRVKKAGGNLSNGFWGEKIGEEGEDEAPATEAEIKMTKDGVDKTISLEEFKKHNTEESAWFVTEGHVYDGTAFMKEHPGGAQSIICAAATDATEEFMAIHSESAKAMMPDYHIGTLSPEDQKKLSGEEALELPKDRETFLHPKVWTKCRLEKKVSVSSDTRVFTFCLDHEEQVAGLPVGKHLMIRLNDPATRESIIRSYTPISDHRRKGYIDVLVKVYFDTPERKGGKMSQALDKISIGHEIDFKGPIGKFEYLSRGRCLVNEKERKVNKFIMISGGSGITPIFQVFRAVLEDKEDKTRCILLDGNRAEEDILCRDDFERLIEGNETRCEVYHTLSKPSESWKGLKGRIAGPLLEKHASVAGDCIALICGPEQLEKSVVKKLKEMGWNDNDILLF